MVFKRAKFFIILTLVLVIGVLTVDAGVSFIGSVHVGGGSVTAEGLVDCSDGTCESVKMSVVGNNMLAWCQDRGGRVVPALGPRRVDANIVLVQNVGQLDADGNFPFYFHTELVPTSTEGVCPNPNWTVVDLTGRVDVTLEVFEAGVGGPADSQSFVCAAVRGEVRHCVRTR